MKLLGGRFLNAQQLLEAGVKSAGHSVLVHETAILLDLQNISIGSHVRIDPFCLLSAAGGELRIGNHVHIAAHVCVFAAAGVHIDDFSGLSHGVKLYSSSDDYSGQTLTNPTIPKHYLNNMSSGPVRVGRHAIVGAGSVILPGCELGDGVSVGAMSLVRKSLEPWTIYSGVPARRMSARRRDLLVDEARLLSEEAVSPLGAPGH